MKFPGTGWFWTIATVLAMVAVCPVPSHAQSDWTYEYQDDFSTDKAQADSYIHSVFWPQGAFPPSEPYLYHVDTGTQQELGFGDYNGEPAYLGYRFPVGRIRPGRAVFGSLQVSVRLPYGSEAASSLSGYLRYRYSDDGVNWSSPQRLDPGSHDILIESMRGACYIIFFGTEMLIDNLDVSLYSSPATIRVPQDAATIQQAIDAATGGDIVEVAPGTYAGDGNRDIDFRGKAITVRSAQGPEATTIDCEGHRGFYFHSAEGPDSVLRGFTIIGAVAPGSQIPADNLSWNSSSIHPIGAGIFCEFSSPRIVDCVLRQCSAELGGGIGVVAGQPVIIDCTIEECRAGGQGTAQSGGRGAGVGLIRNSVGTFIDCTISRNAGYHDSRGAGVYCWRSEARLTGCDISFNSAPGSLTGGGLYCGGSSANLVLANCIISGNTADVGAGIYIGSSAGTSSADSVIESVDITNCTIVRNTLSGTQTASSAAGGIHSVSSDIAVRNSIVWFNEGVPVLLVSPASDSPVLYSDLEGGYSGQGNIDADPLFASVDDADYHLRSLLGRYEPSRQTWVTDGDHSPCIDAGDPQDPLGAEPLTNGKRVNIGAYGGTVEASKGEGAWVFHVDGAIGSDSNSGLGRTNAFATIQRAVDEALNGDTIMVWPGVYREQVILESKAITLQSADDAAVVTAPVGYAFSFYYAESSMCVLRNFVITGCGEAAIHCDGASPKLTNLTVTGNLYGISAWGGADPDITSCILWNNQNGDLYHCRASYSDVEQADAVGQNNGNVSVDPLFADPTGGDYHLMSRYGRYLASQDRWVTDSVTSPCIDAGDPSVRPGRERIPRGGRINMGAYGGTPSASLSGWPSWSDIAGIEPLSPAERGLESVFTLQNVLLEPESTTGTEDYRMVNPEF
ncbi:MAG: hypothetical protein JSW66_09735 [Phycisphaerales bacterium]|nr:MAG: hypothetical protein JSW66_09735 [Phycisphaerales bacterium]